MERITATLDEDLVEDLDRFQKDRGYQNRSEALRDLIRAGLQGVAHENDGGACVGALVYVYDHEVRALAKRLTMVQHDHHDLSVATMHVHLDHNSCLEVAVLRGSSADVRHFSERVIADCRARCSPRPAGGYSRGARSRAFTAMASRTPMPMPMFAIPERRRRQVDDFPSGG